MDQGSVPGNCWRLAFGEQPGYRRSSAKPSMFVVVALVNGVTTTVVDVVDVVAVRDRNMTAAIAVFVFVSNVFGVHRAHYTSLPRTVARRTVSTPVRVPY